MNLLSKRSIAVCLSTTESGYQQMLHDQIECNTIYSTKYENGTLYGMLLTKAKTHKTLDNAISRLDTLLKNSDRGTRFVSISNVLGCKVKTFAKGEHATDEHFKAIFISKNPGGGNVLKVQSGVNQWKPDAPHHAVFEFDVVKKRTLMETASDHNDDTCPLALQQFEEFEAHVLDALFNVSQDYQALRLNELLELEEAVQTGTPPAVGLVYVAVSECIKHPKIGATRRSDPAQRMKELSKSVPSPFECRMYVRTKTPFKLESQIHKHFDAHRIKKKGACTEFFNIDPRVICEYLKTQFEVVEPQSISPNAASR
jgi:hypothetical protein